MRYSYEFKLKCIELYHQGIEVLKPKSHRKVWTPQEKYELVAKVLNGQSNQVVAIEAGV